MTEQERAGEVWMRAFMGHAYMNAEQRAKERRVLREYKNVDHDDETRGA